MSIDAGALDALFRDARTHNAWTDQPVSDDDLRAVFEVMKWGPTSANCSPARFVFVRTVEARQQLRPALSVHILPRNSIGVEYPTVSVQSAPLQPVGLMWTDSSFDEARARMATIAVLLAQLGEAETALWRLLAEQRKTQKRVNALKYNVIPRYRSTIRYVESLLSEEERNSLFQLKVLRGLLEEPIEGR